MKILVVEPNVLLEPVGLSYIVAVLKKAGHSVSVLAKNSGEDLGAHLSKNSYDFVGTGGLSHTYKQIEKIVIEAKKHGLKVILGGGIVTSEPEIITRALQVDYAVLGEGEDTIVELLSCLEKNGNPESVNGIAFLRDGDYVQTKERKPIKRLDSLPIPDWDAFGLEKTLETQNISDLLFTYYVFDNPRPYSLLASRSCPFSCSFCYHPLGKVYRQRSVASIMEELEYVIGKYKINIINILDELFSYNLKRVYEFCERIKELQKNFSWKIKWVCQLRVDKLSDEMLDVMKDAGCFMISFGFESYSQTVIQSMKKKITPEQMHKAIHMTYDKRIGIQGNFIFGDVAETKKTAMETLRFWKKHSFAGVWYGFILIIPNSPLYQYCVKNNIIKNRLDRIKHHLMAPLNVSKMSADERLELEHKLIQYRLKFFPRVTALSVSKKSITFECPRCMQVNEYKNYDYRNLNSDLLYFAPTQYLFNTRLYCRECNQTLFVSSPLFGLYYRVLLFVRNYPTVKLWRKFVKPLVQYLRQPESTT